MNRRDTTNLIYESVPDYREGFKHKYSIWQDTRRRQGWRFMSMSYRDIEENLKWMVRNSYPSKDGAVIASGHWNTGGHVFFARSGGDRQ